VTIGLRLRLWRLPWQRLAVTATGDDDAGVDNPGEEAEQVGSGGGRAGAVLYVVGRKTLLQRAARSVELTLNLRALCL
jgi:hypothetical protein